MCYRSILPLMRRGADPMVKAIALKSAYLQIRRKLSLGDCFVHLEHRCPPYGWHFSARFSTTLQEFP